MNLIFLLSLITLSSADDDIFGLELSSGSEDTISGSGLNNITKVIRNLKIILMF